MSAVRDRLRAATADAHLLLETELDLPRALRTRGDILAMLARLAGFFRPLEAALDAALGPAVMAGRHRAADLEADLRALGLAPGAIAALPLCPDAGALAGPAACWGALYVVEGARLGGRGIARDLARRDLAYGLRFWTADPAGGERAWPHFMSILEGVGDPEEAERGALATFARLHAWMAARTRGSG